MTRIYFTLDGTDIDITEAVYENDAKAELELAIANGNPVARLLLETDATEDLSATYERLKAEIEREAYIKTSKRKRRSRKLIQDSFERANARGEIKATTT